MMRPEWESTPLTMAQQDQVLQQEYFFTLQDSFWRLVVVVVLLVSLAGVRWGLRRVVRRTRRKGTL